MSPEMIKNNPYNFKADIWSLGVVIYEICCLKTPFESNNFAELAMKIIR
jgi:NIMA (never in mitosis gene a)-related kinase